MHAGELTGSSVALAIAEDALRLLVDPAGAVHDLPAHVVEGLSEDLLLYVLPRMSPDGAEEVLRSARFVRSNVRDHRIGRTEPYWRAVDVDGDGQSRLMRVADAAGDFVASAEVPGLMLPRRIEDPGPYYRIYPEGRIENWDGFTIPAPVMMADMETDLNRNFPAGWRGEPHQVGAGPYPLSEPESRAVTEFVARHPNLFAWMNLHTFGGCFIRPHGDLPDKKMDQSDLALFHQLSEWADEHTGYPMVSGFEEFTYEPDKPLCGDMSQWAYVERGIIAFVVELWDFFAQAGLEVHRPFVFNYQRRTREECVAIARWDREHNRGRVVGTWTPFEHPQLGKVEIGGYDPRIGIWNPPPERLAALAPRVRCQVEVVAEGDGLSRVRATVENVGYLPSYVLSSGRSLPLNGSLRATLELGNGVTLVAGEPRPDLGHLEGWGGYRKWQTPILARSSGVPTKKRVEWLVRGAGQVRVHVASPRTGSSSSEARVG
jgi:hypothetical protein